MFEWTQGAIKNRVEIFMNFGRITCQNSVISRLCSYMARATKFAAGLCRLRLSRIISTLRFPGKISTVVLARKVLKRTRLPYICLVAWYVFSILRRAPILTSKYKGRSKCTSCAIELSRSYHLPYWRGERLRYTVAICPTPARHKSFITLVT